MFSQVPISFADDGAPADQIQDKRALGVTLKQLDLSHQTAATLESCATHIRIIKVLHIKQQGLPRRPEKRTGNLAPFVNGRYFLQMLPNAPLESSVWIGGDKLNIFTEYYPYNLTQFRGALKFDDVNGRPTCISEDGFATEFILYELVQGVNYLHSLGVVKLNLQPSNILLTPERHCIISDFSKSVLDPAIKRKENHDLCSSSCRMVNLLPGFCAPEILDGRIFTAKADLWSLGMVIFDVICPDYLPSVARQDMESAPSYYSRLSYTDLRNQMSRRGVPQSMINLVLGLCTTIPVARKTSKQVAKTLRAKNWSDSSSFDSPSPLIKYRPTHWIHLPEMCSPVNPLFELSTSEAIRRLRKRVLALCDHELPFNSGSYAY